MEGSLSVAGLTHRLRNHADPPRPLGGFATTMVVLLIVFAALYAIGFLFELAYIGVIQSYLSGDATVDEIEDMQLASSAVQSLAALLYLVVAGFFIAWTYRAYMNLVRTSVEGLRYEPGWAIGAWFIPIFNWIRPKQVVNDIWRAGEAGIEVRDGSWRDRPVSQLLHWWWAVWVATAILGIVAFVVGWDTDAVLGGAPDYERAQEAATITAVGMLCSIAAAILACIMIRRITDRDDRLRAAVLAATTVRQASPPPPPVQPGGSPPPPPVPPGGPTPPPTELPAQPGEPGAEPLVTTGSKVRCTICGWVFNDPQSAREHLATHHRGRAKADPRS